MPLHQPLMTVKWYKYYLPPLIDGFPLFEKLPLELKRMVVTHALLLHMRDIYSTNYYEEMAKRICEYGPGPDRRITHCCIAALVSVSELVTAFKFITFQLDIGVHIPPPRGEGQTVFHIAADAGDTSLIRRLVRLGYDINATRTCGETALHCIASKSITYTSTDRESLLRVLHTLCEEGADANIPPEDILYALLDGGRHCSQFAHKTFMDALKLLLKHGASTSSALHRLPSAPMIEMLLNAGADIEEVWNGMTPLTVAASMKNVDAVKALLHAGANPNRDVALFAAIEPARNYEEICASAPAQILTMLCDAGADMTRLDHHNHSVLSFALTTV